MFKQIKKYIYMVALGAKYIKIFRHIFQHPFMTLREKHRLLSKERQNYSNAVLKLLNIEVELHGKIPEEERIVYAINHRSLLDIIVMEHIFSASEKKGVWIAKQELFDAIYGEFFKNSGCVSVDLETKKGLVRFFKEIKLLLAKIDDLNIYIFPEGERNKTDEILPFQGGAVKIAKANNLKIVPVYINDKLEKVFRASPFDTPYKVNVYIGDIIEDPETLQEKYLNLVKEVQSK
ncbi:MAG: 1-acyl-sn-glycerol-3-phosphate acyltransferase [Epsilonproteobacteria bacterium]|nr:1-acyl-sn-glycerol-3-phosphate acyltransferase [Campylobacterota bacterium]